MKTIFFVCLIAILGVSCQEQDPVEVEDSIMHFSFAEPPAIYYNYSVAIDMNDDGLIDFLFFVGQFYVDGMVENRYVINSLRDGKIRLINDEAVSFDKDIVVSETNAPSDTVWNVNTGHLMVRTDRENQPSEWSGTWYTKQEGYLAVSFTSDNKRFYGWIRLFADPENSEILVMEYAYNTLQGELKTGETGIKQ